ncbi:MAG: helix-turn-helix domain-containing protein [Lachnospiraceae bacterium]|nr:helix-turn-helix domain-containing protein [Lachnospiraceae bacterium]
MNIEQIGLKITEERKRLGFTQEQLAEKLGVSAQAVSKWENGWNLPDIENMNKLADILGMPLNSLFRDKGNDADFFFRDRLFREDKMFTRVRTIAQTEHLYETYRALSYMRESHEGQYRKKGRHSAEHISYINHPLMMACHAYYLGVRDDIILASILLHDVVEDTSVRLEDLPFSENVKRVVELVSFYCPEGENKDEAKKAYYNRIMQDERACVVKVIDRCNNVSTMAQAFSRDKLIEYVNETEKYVMPVLKKIKEDYPKYADMAFIVKYHIISVIETVKNMIDQIP